MVDNDDVVAKIYHPHRLNQALVNKINMMVSNPPEDDTRTTTLNHVSIAWPTTTIIDEHNDVFGYLMPKITTSNNLYTLIQPQQRQKRHSNLNHRHLYRTARNIAFAMQAIHKKNYVIGDVNFNNILFNDVALVTLIDCDSMQIIENNGTVHHCIVGVPEYTPPELQGSDFETEIRTTNHDAFGLAVLIFQLLMQGFHPFTGHAKPGTPDVVESHVHCIKNQIFPYVDNQFYYPPKVAPRFDALPASIRHLFIRAFTQINNRPTPSEWTKVIDSVEKRLVKCTNDPHHYYPSDGTCVICEIEYKSGRIQQQIQTPLATNIQPSPPQVKRKRPAAGKKTPKGSPPSSTASAPSSTPSGNTGILRPLPLPSNTGPLPTNTGSLPTPPRSAGLWDSIKTIHQWMFNIQIAIIKYTFILTILYIAINMLIDWWNS